MQGDEGNYPVAGFGDDIPRGYSGPNIVQRMDEAFNGEAKPDREAGPVVKYLAHLDLEIDRLDHALSQLIDKLNPILNPTASGEPGSDVAEKSQSRLSHELEAKCERVHTIASILTDVTRRVEL